MPPFCGVCAMSKLECILWAVDFGVTGVAYFVGGPYAGLVCFFVAGVLILIGLTRKDESESASQPTTLLVDYADRPYKSSPKGEAWHKWGLAGSSVVLIILLFYGARKYAHLGRTETEPKTPNQAERPPAQLLLQLHPDSGTDTPTHISIRANEPFTVQITNLGPGDAEGLHLKLRTSDGCKFTEMPDSFYGEGSQQEIRSDASVINSIQAHRMITGKFLVDCFEKHDSFGVNLYYWCPTCPNDNKWSDPVIVVIKRE
jgi:hypothetical protein